MKTAVLIAMIVLADAAGDVFLTRGMKQVGEISTLNPGRLLNIGRKAVRNRSFLSGIFFMAVTFFSFLIVLSWADLSFVFPTKSLVYFASTLGAKWFLKETISLERWGGILLVCLGVALISLPET
jgi:drug/metabolite transporter (DMT)-like permease